MQALQNFNDAINESEVSILSLEIIQLVELAERFVIMTWDAEDQVYLVNNFCKKSLDFDNTHTWTDSYQDAFVVFIGLINLD